MTSGAEDRLLIWLRRQLRKQGYDTIGDDAAMLPAGGPWAITVDHQIEGVHYPSGLDPGVVARRLLAVNLSDLAAIGAEPLYAFLALSCPEAAMARRFLTFLLRAATKHSLELAGGDLSRGPSLAATLTLVGRRIRGGRWLRRDNARAGDRIWLGGQVGLSALGRRLLALGAHPSGNTVTLPDFLVLSPAGQRLARRAVRSHLAPEPRLELSRWLARRKRAAAIDLSDGLAIDLHRLCRESLVGAELVAADLRQARHFASVCAAVDLDPEELMLRGGEDYSLLFTLPRSIKPPGKFDCQPIGWIVPGRRVLLVLGTGSMPLSASGWDHFS